MKYLIFIIATLIFIPTAVISQSCLPEGITFKTQAQIDSFQVNYPNCKEIEGDVFIGDWSGSDITNLDGLNVLTSIGGNMWIGIYSINGMGWLECDGNTNLEDITGLSSLTTIGGDLGIFCNDSIVDLSGLESLTNIGGSLRIGYAQKDNWIGLQIAGNQSLTNITALAGITSIGGDIEIMGNVSLTNLAGLENIDANSIEDLSINYNSSLATCEVQSICAYLANPPGTIKIYENGPGCSNPAEIANACGFQIPCLPYGNYYFSNQVEVDSFQVYYQNCTELLGSVIIAGDDIVNLHGLSGVTSIGGNLSMINNELLTGLEGLNDLQTIGGALNIGKPWVGGNPSLINLTGLESLNAIGGEINISGNGALISLQGIENIDAESIQSIGIYSNPYLSNCEVQSICDYLVNPNGDVSIGHNAPGCNNENQVKVLCDNTGCLVEGIAFSSQADIDSFQIKYPHCSIILGDVKIQGDDIINLNGLNGLTSCWGDLLIQNNVSLFNLSGLDSLTSIAGHLSIINNDFLSDFVGLNNLTAIDGHLAIKSNNAMTSLSGLDNLTSIEGSLMIYNNNALTSLTGLDNVNSIKGNFKIKGNDAMTSLTGLDNVTSIEGDIKIEDNDALISLTGLESLNTIGDLLFINDNNELITLSGIENIDAVSILYLAIINNESLSACHVLSICNYLGVSNGTFAINNNAPGCNSQQEVLDSCDFSSVADYGLIESISVNPNPFSTSTTIEYELKTPSHIQITIFNHIGKQVEIMVIEHQPQGKHEVMWNAEGLPAGIYFCVVKTESGLQTIKMIKMK